MASSNEIDRLVQVVAEAGGKMTYPELQTHFSKGMNERSVQALRSRLKFSLENVDGVIIHYVSIKPE